MRRMRLFLAVAATMVMMLAVTAGPALAADNDRHTNRIESRLDQVDNRIDSQLDRLDNALLVGDMFTGDHFNDGIVIDNGLASDIDFDHGIADSHLDIDH